MKRSKIKAIEETINKIQAFLDGGIYNFGRYETCPFCIEAAGPDGLLRCAQCFLVQEFNALGCGACRPTGVNLTFASIDTKGTPRRIRVEYMRAAMNDLIEYLNKHGYEVVDEVTS